MKINPAIELFALIKSLIKLAWPSVKHITSKFMIISSVILILRRWV